MKAKRLTPVYRLLGLFMCTLFGVQNASAQEAYAVYTSDNTTLTFYYDNNRSTHESNQNEAVYDLPTSATQPAWYTDGTYSNVTKVNFPGSFASARPTSTSYWFYHMSSLTSISNLHNLNTSSVKTMNQMFAYCTGLTNLDLSNFDTSNVTTMQSMFWECTGLTSINMCYFNTEKVTTMYGMFRGCSALTTLDIRSFKTTSLLTEIQEMFYQCSNLTTIYAGAGWNYTRSDSQVFNGSSKLVGGNGTAYDPNHLDASYARVDAAGTPGYFTRVPYAVWDSSAKSLTFYDDGKGSEKTGVVYNLNIPGKLPEWRRTASGGYTSMTSVVFDPSFASARPTSTNAWFSQMTALTSIQGIEYLNTSEVTNMSGMFHGIKNITSIDLSHFNTANVTTMAQMFQECTGLTEIDLSKFNTANVTAMNQMFDGCTGLTELDLSKFNTAKVTNMNYMFRNCTGLTELDLSKFNTANVRYMNSMFNGCSNLDHIIVSSNWKTTGVTVANSAEMFTGCTSIVGGAGTTYNASYVDKTYARVDGGTSNPGYLTGQPEEYSIVKDNVCTHYYDGFRLRRLTETGGYDYEGQDWWREESWDGENFDKVIFDPSFANSGISIDQISASISGMSNLTSIEGLEYSNSQYATDMSYLFRNCTGLTTLDLSSFDTRNVTDMREMFRGCTSLKTIIVGENWSVANVTNSTNMFEGCTSLVGQNGTTYNANYVDKTFARVDVPENGKAGYLTGMPYAVYANGILTFYCDGERSKKTGTTYNLNTGTKETEWYSNRTNVTKVVFDPSFAAARPSTTHGWFEYHAKIASFEGFEYLNTSEVTDMGNMFVNCVLQETFDLSNFDTGNVTNMQAMFMGCRGLTTLDLSSFDTRSLASMGYMFYGCTNLTTIYVSNKWNIENVGSGGAVFYNCSNLKGGAGTTYNQNNVSMAYAHIDGGTSNPGYLTAAPKPYAVYDSSTTTLTFCCDGGWYSSTGTVYDLNEGNNAPAWFRDNEIRPNVTTVVFDASFADARPTSTNQWFSNMGNLTTINGIEYLNTSSVTNMGEMFVQCKKLTSIDLSHFDTHNVEDLGYMFHSCSALKSLDLSSFDTQLVTNTNYMFYNCSALTTIYASDNWDVSHVLPTSSVKMFEGCTNLKGGNGTPYDVNHVDKSYAIIDGTNGLLGYLSYKPYVVYNSSTKTLTFRCDGNQGNHTAETEIVYDLNEGNNSPAWYKDDGTGTNSSVTKVVFDGSFVLARPTSTYSWFRKMKNLTTIEGVENLYTNEVKSMYMMFNDCSSLTSLDVSIWDTSNVTDMYNLFSGCKALESLNVANWNVSNVEIMTQLFAQLDNLTTLDLSGWNTANVKSMKWMFYSDDKLKTIYVGNGWTTDNVSTSTEMFNYSTNLVGMKGTACNVTNNITAAYARVDGGPDSDTPGYLSYKPYAVYDNSTTTLTFYCDGLSSTHMADEPETVYDLNKGDEQTAWYLGGKYSSVKTVTFDPSFANARPTSTKDWFVAMSNLTDIQGLEYLNTSEVTNMKSMFSLCVKLESVDVTGFDTRKVTTMNSMFNECNALEILDLSSFNTSLVTDMNNMFSNCTSLTTIYVKSNWNEGFEGNSSFMFTNCTKLIGGAGTEWDSSLPVDISYAQIDGGEMDPGYFTATPAYAMLSEDGKTLTFYYDGNPTDKTGKKYYLNSEAESPGWVQDNSNRNIEQVVFDSSFANARPTSTSLWFRQMEALTEIEGIGYLNTSEVKSMRFMFYGCSNLMSLNVSGFNTQNVTDMAGMFGDCKLLENIDVSGFNTQNVVYMNWMFQDCLHLTSLDVSSFNTENVTDMAYMFYGCSKLESLDVSRFNTQNVTSMNYMFHSCNSLTSLNVSHFQTGNVTSMSGMFTGCNELTSLDVSGFNTENVVNAGMVYMFSNCEKLTTLDVSNFSTSRVAYFDAMFFECKALTTLNLSNFDTSNAVSLYEMFEGCTALTTLDLSNFDTSNVDDMRSMFNGCSALTTIYVANDWDTETAANETDNSGSSDMFKDCNSLVGGADTHYDAAHVNREYARIDGGSDNPGYFTLKQPEPYVVYNSDNTTLTFYCDLLRYTHKANETVYDLPTNQPDTRRPGWFKTDGTGANISVTTVVFDPSFANARPTITMSWFELMGNLTKIEGIEYLNTSEVTDMSGMFSRCALTIIDASNFDMSNVTNIGYMFYNSTNLTTIYVSNAWSDWNKEGIYSGSMFQGCTSLVGGAGTAYAAGVMDATYAHVDGGTSNPGYFTLKTDFQLGDVNHDGAVNVADVTALVNILNGTSSSAHLGGEADVDGNGFVEENDVKELVNLILGSGLTVDLGLPSGTLWASCNVGANAPEETGDLYRWGETTTTAYYDSWTDYFDTSDGGETFNKYSNFGDQLQVEDDAAYQVMGAAWRMPTYEQAYELKEQCTWRGEILNGVQGARVTGPNGNSIFLPAYRNPGEGNCGFFWTSTNSANKGASNIYFKYSSDVISENNIGVGLRFGGNAIRAVRAK